MLMVDEADLGLDRSKMGSKGDVQDDSDSAERFGAPWGPSGGGTVNTPMLNAPELPLSIPLLLPLNVPMLPLTLIFWRSPAPNESEDSTDMASVDSSISMVWAILAFCGAFVSRLFRCATLVLRFRLHRHCRETQRKKFPQNGSRRRRFGAPGSSDEFIPLPNLTVFGEVFLSRVRLLADAKQKSKTGLSNSGFCSCARRTNV